MTRQVRSKADLEEWERAAVAAEVRELWTAHGTQQKVGKLLGITQGGVNKALAGGAGIGIAQRIEEATGQTLARLVAKHGTMRPPAPAPATPDGQPWRHPALGSIAAAVAPWLHPDTLPALRRIDASPVPDASEAEWLQEIARVDASARRGTLL